MLLSEQRMRLLERLELRDLPRGSGRSGFREASSQAPLARLLPPLGEHEGVDRERTRHRLHLHPWLLT